jgi:MFS transporter, DHA1 family, tetracycline resistance protein
MNRISTRMYCISCSKNFYLPSTSTKVLIAFRKKHASLCSMRNSKNAAVGFIFVTLLLDVMGWGLIIPVMPKLIVSLRHVDITKASSSGAWLISVYAMMQFLFAPVIGNLSDRYGRRPILLLSMFTFSIDYLICAFAPDYGWLFIGRVIAGITGASFSTASAYIADVSTPQTRAKNFGMIGAAFGLGFFLGPLLGGMLSGWGVRAPFIAAAILCFINFLYGYFLLPESLAKTNRRKFDWKRANPLGSLRLLQRYPVVGGLAISFFLIYLAAQSVQGNWNYFTIYRFSWSEKMVGISLAVVGVLVAGVQAGLTRIVNPRLGNERSVYLGFICYSIGLFLFSIATEGWMMFLFLVPYCLGGLSGPALQSILAGHVPPNEQGELQGTLTSLMSLTAVLGPLIMNNLFEYFTRKDAIVYFPGAPFLLGSMLVLFSCFVAYYILHREKIMLMRAGRLPDK